MPKNHENNFYVLSWSQGIQKGRICKVLSKHMKMLSWPPLSKALWGGAECYQMNIIDILKVQSVANPSL